MILYLKRSGCHSPAASDLLPVFLLLRERVVEVFADDGQVARHHRLGAALHKAEHLLLTRRVQIVEENPADAPSLVAMSDEEVTITPEEDMSKRNLFCLDCYKLRHWGLLLLMFNKTEEVFYIMTEYLEPRQELKDWRDARQKNLQSNRSGLK